MINVSISIDGDYNGDFPKTLPGVPPLHSYIIDGYGGFWKVIKIAMNRDTVYINVVGEKLEEKLK